MSAKWFFEHSEYLALRRELPEYLKPVLTFGYYTGARLSEILSVRAFSDMERALGDFPVF